MADADIVLSTAPKGFNRFIQGLVDPKGVKEKDELDKMRKLSDSDLEIFSRGVTEADLPKLSKEALDVFIASEEAKDIDPFEVTDPNEYLELLTKAPLLEKGVETGVDMLTRGFESMSERAREGGEWIGKGMEDIGQAKIPLVDPVKGVGEIGLGGLFIGLSPGAGIAEMVVPPTVKQRDWWKLGVEMAVPIVPGSLAKLFGKGKPTKFQMNPELLEMLGGKVYKDELSIIGTYHKWAVKNDKPFDNKFIFDIIDLRRKSKAKKGLPVDAVDIPEWATKLGLSEIQIAKMLKEGEESLIKEFQAGSDLINAGIGKRGFFLESLGILPKGLKNSERAFVRTKLAEWASFRASMMTSGVMTSVRNAEVTAQFFIVDAIDRALQGAFRAILNHKTISSQELGASFMYLGDLLKTVNPMSLYKGTANKANQIFRAKKDVLAKSMAFARRTYDNTLPGAGIPARFAAVASVLNNMQEYFFRRIAIEASLRNQLRAVGKEFSKVHPSEITDEMMNIAIENGFRMTMAKGAPHVVDPVTKRVNQHMIERLTDNGFFKLFIMPFPRFVFRNMLPFIRDHSPFGYLQAFKPSTVRKMLEGNPEEFAKYASRAMIGSTFTGFAMQMRKSDEMSTYTTPSGKRVRAKYFEWVRRDAEGKQYRLDLRVISPTVGPYLYMAEAFLHPENVTPSDLAELAFGLRRSGAILMDVSGLFTETSDPSESDDKAYHMAMGKIIGEFASSFTPRIIDSLVEIAAGRGIVDPEVAGRRSSDIDITEDNAENFTNMMLATFQKNMPILKQVLPLKYDVVDIEKGGIYDISGVIPSPFKNVENTLVKQLVGLRVEKIHPIRAEFDALGMKYNYPSKLTGVGPIDNIIRHFMAQEMNSKGGLGDIIKSPMYKKLKGEEAQTTFISRHIYGRSSKNPDGVYRRALSKTLLGLLEEVRAGNMGALDLFMKASTGANLMPSAISDPQKRRDITGELNKRGANLPPDMRAQNFLSELIKGAPSGSDSLNLRDLTENIVKGGK